jgi:hypothetical protein
MVSFFAQLTARDAQYRGLTACWHPAPGPSPSINQTLTHDPLWIARHTARADTLPKAGYVTSPRRGQTSPLDLLDGPRFDADRDAGSSRSGRSGCLAISPAPYG